MANLEPAGPYRAPIPAVDHRLCHAKPVQESDQYPNVLFNLLLRGSGKSRCKHPAPFAGKGVNETLETVRLRVQIRKENDCPLSRLARFVPASRNNEGAGWKGNGAIASFELERVARALDLRRCECGLILRLAPGNLVLHVGGLHGEAECVDALAHGVGGLRDARNEGRLAVAAEPGLEDRRERVAVVGHKLLAFDQRYDNSAKGC
mmetsp:Transcript_10677/g.30144  ORF Transcript_10677/g.30144 Transcript_10677/m.30144 type:complete len:206 (+) Transcript_10677:652-1269(+)